jgi:hypothetical protein
MTQTLQDEAVRRAVEGIRRPVLYRGKQVYIHGEPLFDIEYSDQLLIRLLVRCPGHNVIDSDPSDNHGTESVYAGSDRCTTKRVE